MQAEQLCQPNRVFVKAILSSLQARSSQKSSKIGVMFSNAIVPMAMWKEKKEVEAPIYSTSRFSTSNVLAFSPACLPCRPFGFGVAR
jgi:hypothetical protein